MASPDEPRGAPTRNELLAHVWEIYESGALLTSCAWCGRVLVGDAWVSCSPDALQIVDEPMMVSHSICPGCTGRVARPPGQAKESGGGGI